MAEAGCSASPWSNFIMQLISSAPVAPVATDAADKPMPRPCPGITAYWLTADDGKYYYRGYYSGNTGVITFPMYSRPSEERLASMPRMSNVYFIRIVETSSVDLVMAAVCAAGMFTIHWSDGRVTEHSRNLPIIFYMHCCRCMFNLLILITTIRVVINLWNYITIDGIE